jgi:hypothetical protein
MQVSSGRSEKRIAKTVESRCQARRSLPTTRLPVTNLANFLEARFWIPSLFPTLS